MLFQLDEPEMIKEEEIVPSPTGVLRNRKKMKKFRRL